MSRTNDNALVEERPRLRTRDDGAGPQSGIVGVDSTKQCGAMPCETCARLCTALWALWGVREGGNGYPRKAKQGVPVNRPVSLRQGRRQDLKLWNHCPDMLRNCNDWS
jgi:hypothetical protein